MDVKNEISVVIHTLNSERVIRQCLEGVKDFDEIIICDMYSEDDTLRIASEYNAKIVMHEPCNGFVEPARTFATQQATKDWVFVVDSDEKVPSALREYLYDIIKKEDCPDALFVPRKNYFMGRFLRASFPDYQLRFFKKDRFVNWPSTVHSRPKIDGICKKIPKKKSLAFDHILEKNDIRTTVQKMNIYSDHEVDKRKNEKASVAGLIFKSTFRFLKSYILKGGFLEGKEGFIYATLNSYYKYLTIAKMLENQSQRKK